MRKRLGLLSIAMIGVFLLGSGPKEPACKEGTQSAAPKALIDTGGSASAKVDISFGKIPLHFIPNQGQVDSCVAYYVQGRDKTIYFTPEGLTFLLSGARDSESARQSDKKGRIRPSKQALGLEGSAGWVLSDEGDGLHGPGPGLGELPDEESSERWVVKLDFVGANPGVRPVGLEETGTLISYFKGKPEEWKTGLPAYSKILYEDLWPGVDLLYYGTYDRMKYEFIVRPGADPSQIRLAYRGAESVRLTDEGRLAAVTPLAVIEDDVPVAWQEKEGAQTRVSAAYVLEAAPEDRALDHPSASGDAPAEEKASQRNPVHVFGFEVGEYDHDLPLVLDPAILLYCGYMGGSLEDFSYAIALDGSGNIYVIGQTNSTQVTFPVTTGPDLTQNGNYDVFVAKANSSGTALVYCGYLGGSEGEVGRGIAVDASGNAYVTGYAYSTQVTFPVTTGPDLTHNGSGDVFVAKINSSGTGLLYCGYIGGSAYDFGYGIAVDGSGNAYVTGYTKSSQITFPVTAGLDMTYNGSYDAFAAKVNSSGTNLAYCGYIGGVNDDYGYGIAVDGSGNAYITGETLSTEATFPEVSGPDLTYNGGDDAFVAKVNSSGTGLVYCGYIGGTADDSGYGIAVDSYGNAYVAGKTESTETTFPVKNGPDLTHNGSFDAFVAKVSSAGTDLVYCGYIGGSGSNDQGLSIALSSMLVFEPYLHLIWYCYVSGRTNSSEATFPVKSGPDLTYNGGDDAFVARLNPSGTALLYCGYVGGSGYDYARGIAVDGYGNAYITGETSSTQATLPVMIGPDLTHNGALYDAFVAKISPETAAYAYYIFDGHDFNGNGSSDVSVFRPSNGRWYLKGIGSFAWGSGGDIPTNGDYNDDKVTDIAVWRPSNGRWYIKDIGGSVWGTSGDMPVPGDYDGDGDTDLAVWRPSNGRWYIKDIGGSVWGTSGDMPVPGDYDGDGDTDLAVWRPSNGHWYIKDAVGSVWGTLGDIPVPADYDGDGTTDIAVWRPSNGRWYIKGVGGSAWGTEGDIPAPGDYDGDGVTDIAVWRPSNGRWYIKGIGSYAWGTLGDIPLVR
jgi:hypothetical protein